MHFNGRCGFDKILLFVRSTILKIFDLIFHSTEVTVLVGHEITFRMKCLYCVTNDHQRLYEYRKFQNIFKLIHGNEWLLHTNLIGHSFLQRPTTVHDYGYTQPTSQGNHHIKHYYLQKYNFYWPNCLS